MSIRPFGKTVNEGLVDYALTAAGLDIAEALFKHLDPQDVCRLSRVAKSFNRAVQLYFYTEISNFNFNMVFERARFVALNANSDHRNLTNFNTSLKEKIRAYSTDEQPPEVQTIVNSESCLTPDQATQLINFIQARDTLIVWRVISQSIEAEENISEAFVSCDAAIAKAGGFSDWIEQNQAQLANLEWLHLHSNQLTSVPKELGKLASLQGLYLRNNQLTSVPAELGNLASLQGLHLGQNQLTTVPKELGNLPNLQRLYLDNNRLTSVPSELGNLANLEHLELDNNQLTEVPAELGDLTQLQHLYLSSNQLTSAPKELGNLANLGDLYLENNQLSSVPSELGQLGSLWRLHLGGNQLTSVPTELGNLANLRSLGLRNNQLTSVPVELGNLANLTHLHLSHNQLISVPKELGKLANLRVLQLEHNSLSLMSQIRWLCQFNGTQLGKAARSHTVEIFSFLLGVTVAAVTAYAAHSFGILESTDLSGALRSWTASATDM